MIDLIIPYYNNIQGLTATLLSINYDIFEVTIVDDGSNTATDLAEFFNCNLILKENEGPGLARQVGMMSTENDYIMFIDTGDMFLTKEIQEEIVRAIVENMDAEIINFPYYHKGKITDESDTRMHGKVYKRSFIDKYDITFCAQSSFMNEDVGFNRTCRLLQNNMVYIDIPIIWQTDDPNSLTNKDKGAVLYKDQTRALSLVSIHTIQTCRKNGVHADLERDQIAAALYYWFVRCAAERPEYLPNAWSGAKIFYDYFRDEINPNNLSIGSAEIKKCLEYRDKVNFPINIIRFANDIWESEILKNNYLT